MAHGGQAVVGVLEEHAAVDAVVLGVAARVAPVPDVGHVVLVEQLEVLLALIAKERRRRQLRIAALGARCGQPVHVDEGVVEGQVGGLRRLRVDRQHADMSSLRPIELADELAQMDALFKEAVTLVPLRSLPDELIMLSSSKK